MTRCASGSKTILRREYLRKGEEEIGLAMRRRVTDRGEARGVLLLRRAVSYGSGDHRWRTKLYLGSGEPFDFRLSTADRARHLRHPGLH